MVPVVPIVYILGRVGVTGLACHRGDGVILGLRPPVTSVAPRGHVHSPTYHLPTRWISFLANCVVKTLQNTGVWGTMPLLRRVNLLLGQPRGTRDREVDIGVLL